MTNIFKMTMFVAVCSILFNITGWSGPSDNGAVCDPTVEYCESVPPPPVPETDKDACIGSGGIWGDDKCTAVPELSFNGALEVSAPKQSVVPGYSDNENPRCYARYEEKYGSDVAKYWIVIDIDYTDHVSLSTELEGLSDKGEFNADSLEWGLRKAGFPYQGGDVNGKVVVEDIFLQRPSAGECVPLATIGYIKVSIDMSGTFELSGLYAKYADSGDATVDGDISCVTPITYSNCIVD